MRPTVVAALAALVIVSALASCRPPPLPEGVAPLSAGQFSTCALTASSGVQCWGSNFRGQLGDGGTASSVTPVDVVGLSEGVIAVTVGDSHACALTELGSVVCWGENSRGELGNAVPGGRSSVPVQVQGLSSGVTAIAAGDRHTCALLVTGGLKCWGYNYFGQAGTGYPEPAWQPTDVIGLTSEVYSVTAGRSFTCAALVDRTAMCWGNNFRRKLGTFQTADAPEPVAVPGLTDVEQIAAGDDHACALTGSGGVKCWGNNGSGQAGDGSTGLVSGIVDVVGLSSGVTSISAGGQFSCAVMDIGAAKCWGRNAERELGDGTTSDSRVPVDVLRAGSRVRFVEAGQTHACALIAGGTIQCWGEFPPGNSGRLGVDPKKPLTVPGLPTDVATMIASNSHTCAATGSGSTWCWGKPYGGREWTGTDPTSAVPGQVVGLAPATVDVAAGDGHTCALTAGGGVKCWGTNTDGQLGNGTTDSSTVPVDVVGLSSGVHSIAAAEQHTCAATATTTYCWGRNTHRQVNEADGNRLVPTPVEGLDPGVQQVATGARHTCVVTAGGTIQCWGDNQLGQLGGGSLDLPGGPIDVVGVPSGATAVTAGTFHTCAIVDGGAKCWGIGGPGSHGELGNDPSTGSTLPVGVAGLSAGVTSIDAGASHTCAIQSGAAHCWGANNWGKLGNGSSATAAQPTAVTGLTADVVAISAGHLHTCAVTADGAGSCWGWDGSGQIGLFGAIPVEGGAIFYDQRAPED